MNHTFYKYQGTGNDFILFDDRRNNLNLNSDQVKKLCDRKFGIGADGVILLRLRESYDFEMIYFNSDGNVSSMCGNGSRCIVSFARKLGIVRSSSRFLAADGPHEADIISHDPDIIKLKMKDVFDIQDLDGGWLLDTGSPHFVLQVSNVSQLDVKGKGAEIRNRDRFKSEGVNVNFAQSTVKGLYLRTYERGVEDETLSCGTGVTAAALVAMKESWMPSDSEKLRIDCPGGSLYVYAEKKNSGFKNVWLEGPAVFVFSGEVMIKKN